MLSDYITVASRILCPKFKIQKKKKPWCQAQSPNQASTQVTDYITVKVRHHQYIKESRILHKLWKVQKLTSVSISHRQKKKSKCSCILHPVHQYYHHAAIVNDNFLVHYFRIFLCNLTATLKIIKNKQSILVFTEKKLRLY